MKEGVSITDLDDLLKRICEVEEKNEELVENMSKAKKGSAKDDDSLLSKCEQMAKSIFEIGKSTILFINVLIENTENKKIWNAIKALHGEIPPATPAKTATPEPSA